MAPNKRRKLSHDSPQPAIDVSDVDWEPQFQVATRKKAPPQGGHQLYTSAYDPGLNLHYRVQLDGDGEAWSAIKQYKAFQSKINMDGRQSRPVKAS